MNQDEVQAELADIRAHIKHLRDQVSRLESDAKAHAARCIELYGDFGWPASAHFHQSNLVSQRNLVESQLRGCCKYEAELVAKLNT